MPALSCPACGAPHSEFDSRCSACGATLTPAPSDTRVDGIPPRPQPVFTENEPLTGQQISHFQILSRIGSGGMGMVFRALDLELNREVALKFLHPHREGQERDQVRFHREAQAAAVLDHPNIGTIYEVGERDGRRFIAMALYDGETLAARLARSAVHQLAPSEAAATAGQLASALEAAHAAGLVHRDLKPDNIMILRDGRVKLIDFGLARWEGSSRMTEQGLAVGTAAYMAPEQLRNQEVGAAADLWALGVVIYEMVAGHHPFGGERQGMVHNILYESPVPLGKACESVPPVLAAIVERCLSQEPRDRPSAAGVIAELQASGLWFSSGSGVVIPPLQRRSRRVWITAGILGLLLLLAAAAYLVSRKPAPLVYVAVLKPEVSGSLAGDESAQVKANLQAALLRTVAALNGLAALDSSQVNAVSGPPAAVARAVAAGEVVAARAECAGDLCQVSLSRLDGRDGRVLWTEALQLPPSKPRLFADAVAVALRTGYARRDLRIPRLELETSDEDYRTYLDLRRQAADPAAYQKVLDGLGALRQKSPGFLEVYSLEANVARRLYLIKSDSHYLERGIQVAQQARERAPADPRPLANLFDLFLDAGRYEEADTVLTRLAEADPAGSLLRRGQLLERQGHPEQALELIAAAVRLQPSWRSLLILANAEYRQGRLADARRNLAELLRRAPGNTDGLKALAQIELLHDTDRAIALLSQIAAKTPDTDSLTNLGVAQLLRRRYVESEKSLRRALELQPGSPAATLNLADSVLLQGRKAEARILYARIVAEANRDPRSDWENLATKAQALAHLGEPTRAVEAIQQALRLTPDNAQLAYEAALVYALVGDQSSALVNAQRAMMGGVDSYWFALPFFDSLRATPAFQALKSHTR
ncbi:MAG TPA: protein kinase [Thermoanaerobaculia bacterium]|nr:protein kinase [Thermoanaerobaculia bacterium]